MGVVGTGNDGRLLGWSLVDWDGIDSRIKTCDTDIRGLDVLHGLVR